MLTSFVAYYVKVVSLNMTDVTVQPTKLLTSVTIAQAVKTDSHSLTDSVKNVPYQDVLVVMKKISVLPVKKVTL